ncbi:putative heparan-alpha-glucosaminide N-acetyltransferase [Helianthus annuus]|nr:putative heparan-alpha-glucosaminide N-acetyltransferase [Helianthus annuus]KAJ0758383.1 putative heparan-alpha-glucosaminide N-acetyltransferase [Helianthus annuus]
MSSIVPVTETDERSPLLQNSSHYAGEITPFTSPSPDDQDLPSSSTRPTNSTDPKQRLVSLDVFRGLTVALMILVDDAGGAFPSINHSPWFGVTLADFAMPFFLFIVGVSVSLVFKKVSSKPAATKKVVVRTIKLFLLGLVLQGGYFHGRDDLTYGVDINQIRWMGVLQRIAIGYLLASITEIWCVNNNEVNSAIAFGKKYYIQWVVVFLLGILYMALLYGLYVPDWTFEVVNESSSLSVLNYGTETQTVHCGVRGSLEPPCNAVGLIDRFILGESHLYQRPVYKRTEECSINSPDYGPLPPNAPSWCLAPFDPEGLLSSLMAAITCFLGLQYGHIMVHYKGHMQRIIIWLVCSSSLLVLGYVFTVIGVPLSKPLYTLSYMCITTGASGILLIAIYYTADVINIRKPMILFQWMGLNALIVYALAACDIFPAALQGVYWRSPENNLITATELLFETVLHSEKWESRELMVTFRIKVLTSQVLQLQAGEQKLHIVCRLI